MQNNTTAVRSGIASQQPRFSLLDGSYHANAADTSLDGEDQGAASTALAKRAQQALQLSGELLLCSCVMTTIGFSAVLRACMGKRQIVAQLPEFNLGYGVMASLQ